MRTPLHRFNNDMVFVDGEMLKSAGWEGELDPHSYYIDYEKGQVYIGVDPTNRLVEITAFDGALIRTSGAVNGKTNDHKGPVIRGITFTQYARRAIEIEGKRSFGPNDEPTDEPVGPSDPATYGKEATGTTLENVTISYCSRVAGFFRGDGLTIRSSLFSDTSTEGVYVIGSADVLLEKNIFRRNNVEGLTGYYPAAVKIFNQSLSRHLPRQPGDGQPELQRDLVRRGQRGRRVRQQLGPGLPRRLLFRDLQGCDLRRQCLRQL